MSRFAEGDHVRVDLPDETDPDHDRYHGLHGTVAVLEDDAVEVTGDNHDNYLVRIKLTNGETAELRWRDHR